MKNLAFHTVTQLKDYYTTHFHYLTYTNLFKGRENLRFERGSERVLPLPSSKRDFYILHTWGSMNW